MLDQLKWWKEWSPELAYVLGFIFADGNVSKDRQNRISVAQSEMEILDKIRAALPAETATNVIVNKTTGILRLDITVPNIRSVMAEYGIVANKTEHGFWPSSMPIDFVRHYIRGFFDGDGYVGLVPGSSSSRGVVTFCCHLEDFLIALSSCLYSLGLSERKPRLNDKKHKNYILAYRTRSDVIALYSILYDGSTIHLDRKKERFDTILEYYRARSSPKGKGHHSAKLTEQDVIAIRRLYAEGKLTQREIGKMFGVNDRNISMIVNNKAWKHVGNPAAVPWREEYPEEVKA